MGSSRGGSMHTVLLRDYRARLESELVEVVAILAGIEEYPHPFVREHATGLGSAGVLPAEENESALSQG